MKETEPKRVIGLQPGVSPKTHEFLWTAFEAGAFDDPSISIRSRNIIAIYFGTQATGPDLASIYGISNQRIKQLLNEGISKLWRNLPTDVQKDYPRHELILKRGQTPRMIEKYKETRTGTPSTRRGIPLSRTQRAKMPEIGKKLWSDPEFRRRNIEGQDRARAEGRGFNAGDSKKNNDKKAQRKPLRENLNGETSIEKPQTAFNSNALDYLSVHHYATDLEIAKALHLPIDEVRNLLLALNADDLVRSIRHHGKQKYYINLVKYS